MAIDLAPCVYPSESTDPFAWLAVARPRITLQYLSKSPFPSHSTTIRAAPPRIHSQSEAIPSRTPGRVSCSIAIRADLVYRVCSTRFLEWIGTVHQDSRPPKSERRETSAVAPFLVMRPLGISILRLSTVAPACIELVVDFEFNVELWHDMWFSSMLESTSMRRKGVGSLLDWGCRHLGSANDGLALLKVKCFQGGLALDRQLNILIDNIFK